MDIQEAVTFLASGHDALLSAKDQKFAKSLMKAFAQGKASEKQEYWLGVLAERAKNGGKPKLVERERVKIGEFTGIAKLFDEAKKHLKFPSITLAGVKLSRAGEKAKVPGSINVLNTTNKDWYGRILETGEFEKSPRTIVPEELVELLGHFAEHPAEVAGDHGKLTGRCAFCNLPLSDERSTEVGYGKICASHFNLPWGK
jgi:hypothetical protein